MSKEGMKLGKLEKLAYGLGDTGGVLVWSSISFYLSIYYTDNVGLSAAAVGTLMLITRLLDGFSDLIMGGIIDKTNTRFGKARPWVLISAPVLAIGFILLFNVPMGLSDSGKLIYAYITYVFVAAVAYTASNLSYTTLMGLLTDRQEERNSISAIRLICSNAAGLTVAVATPLMLKSISYGKIAYIYAAFSLILLLVTFFGTKERVKIEKEKSSSSMKFKEMIPLLAQNKYFFVATALFLLGYTGNNMVNGGLVYYATYILNNNTYFSLLTLSVTIPIILGLPFVPRIAKKFGKTKVMIVGYTINLIGFLVIYFVAKDLVTTLIGTLLIGIGRTGVASNLFALVIDVVDYGEWKTGVRLDGMTNSIVSFGQKVGTGLGSAFVGWIIAWGGYVPNAEQSESSLRAIRLTVSGAPFVFLLTCIIILVFCKLDKESKQVQKELEERKQQL